MVLTRKMKLNARRKAAKVRGRARIASSSKLPKKRAFLMSREYKQPTWASKYPVAAKI